MSHPVGWLATSTILSGVQLRDKEVVASWLPGAQVKGQFH